MFHWPNGVGNTILQRSMDIHRKTSRTTNAEALSLPKDVALLLQGGGALGSFQAGVYEELEGSNIKINWVAGISIGAVNAAIIAGNPAGERIDKLYSFWEHLSSCLPDLPFLYDDNALRELTHLGAATAVSMFGVPGFFHPRILPPLWAQKGSAAATSYYDTQPLVETLNAHVDWDMLNDGPVRLSVGAVDVESGNFVYFDTAGRTKQRLDHRHIMASGALPPGLPAIEIDGRHYWDGGLVSNTPLAHVLEHHAGDILIFQVDLFPAEGPLPEEITDTWSRAKDIQYSSRTRHVTDQYLERLRQKRMVRKVLDKLPEELTADPDVIKLRNISEDGAVNIVHLIYRRQEWESSARDFEFSRATMIDHWKQGRQAVYEVSHCGDLIAKNIIGGKSSVFDLHGRHDLKEKAI